MCIITLLHNESSTMSNLFSLDVTAECVRNIIEANKCGICDKAEGSRFRYSCGHTTCNACVAVSSDCLLCLTPPYGSSTEVPVFDNPLTRRVSNATKLLEVFQRAFDIDVYKRHRLTEQLKIEKSLFPECIQAPIKYCNKRKSSGNTVIASNKKLVFHGEKISPIRDPDMEKSNYIRQWLDQVEKTTNYNTSHRKPFADLNVNQQHISHSTPKKKDVSNIKKELCKQKNRKHTRLKPALSLGNNHTVLDKLLKPIGKLNPVNRGSNKLFESETRQRESMINKNVTDESGIVMDCEPVVINDSQSTIDKDKEALLAVQKADEGVTIDPIPCPRLEIGDNLLGINDTGRSITYLPDFQNSATTSKKNVPFLKMCPLFTSCDACSQMVNKNIEVTGLNGGKSENTTITIENKSFIATITVSNSTPNIQVTPDKHLRNTVSKYLNDNEDYSKTAKNIDHSKKFPLAIGNTNEAEIQSQDFFTDDMVVYEEHKVQPTECIPKLPKNETIPLVIADSDSDIDIDASRVIQVKADVHRSSDQLDCGVFDPLNETEIQLRNRPAKRRVTPGSTDSSDKENYDPNRPKKERLDEKDIKRIKNQKYSRKRKLSALHRL